MRPVKKEKNFWVALDNEDYERINSLAESKNIPLKEFAGSILKKNLVGDKEIAVILKIPRDKISHLRLVELQLRQTVRYHHI